MPSFERGQAVVEPSYVPEVAYRDGKLISIYADAVSSSVVAE